MIRHSLLSILRALTKNPFHNGVNFVGLSISICSALFIIYFVYYEASYDAYHEKKDRIYRVTTRIVSPTSEDHVAWSPMPLAPTLASDYEQVEGFVRLHKWDQDAWVKIGTSSFRQDELYSSDENFFSVFSYRLLHGDTTKVLDRPYTIVLNESTAAKYFPDGNAIGQSIIMDNNEYEVTGVMEDADRRSDIVPSAIVSYTADEKNYISWAITYVLFRTVDDGAKFQPELDKEVDKYFRPDFKKAGSDLQMFLEPLSSLHFVPQHMFDSPKGNIQYLQLFEGLAIFILLLGAINYINISVALSIKRSKEIEIRKNMGATDLQVKLYFLAGAMIFVLASFICGFVMFLLLKNKFFDISGINIDFAYLTEPLFVAILIGVFVLLVLISGVYPSFHTSSVVDARSSSGKVGTIVRKGLITFQFAFSLLVVILTGIVAKQTKFLLAIDPGFKKEQVLIFQLPHEERVFEIMGPLQNDLISEPSVSGVTFCGQNSVPGSNYDVDVFEFENGEMPRQRTVANISVDSTYMNLLGLRIIEGRNFSASSSEPEFLVNESFVKSMEWSSAIDKKLKMKNGELGRVIGVVQDFNYHSPHKKIEPMIIGQLMYPELMLVKISSTDKSKLDALKATWLKHTEFPGGDYKFLTDLYDLQYSKEKTTLSVFNYFSIVMIVTAFFGVFALYSIIVEQSAKEIAIRRVLGGDTLSIGKLLLGKTLMPMVISMIIAGAISFFISATWLSNFEQKVAVGIWIHITAFIGIVAITGLVIGFYLYQSVKYNPSERLRSN
jgi:putative ABC transport system permease protein